MEAKNFFVHDFCNTFSDKLTFHFNEGVEKGNKGKDEGKSERTAPQGVGRCSKGGEG